MATFTATNQMYALLYHTNLPKLVDEGIVTFDSEDKTIARAEHVEQAIAVLAGAGGGLDFEYRGYRITVCGDGWVQVAEPADR
ncbi:hypothetical protein [Natrinema sp. HArc-T2]|uniref:DUF7344 domain-containing protein n=1 Tax=Natrinema sp. HArc-T2 TaxID=3242701 RepID=UPI00359EA005